MRFCRHVGQRGRLIAEIWADDTGRNSGMALRLGSRCCQVPWNRKCQGTDSRIKEWLLGQLTPWSKTLTLETLFAMLNAADDDRGHCILNADYFAETTAHAVTA
jgi:hypothetical protein